MAAKKVMFPLIGRFTHDTPVPQDRYRAGVDSALHLPETHNGSASDIAAIMSKALVDLYNEYGGHKCANRWLQSLEEVPGQADSAVDPFYA